MSRTIDERVVEMRFDNKQFEAGVQTSLSTLDKLKKGLDLDGASKGFEQLSAAAKSCDMSMLGRSVETVQQKFSAFEVVAMTALSNIANSAVNAGRRLLSSLTIEPISTGFNEYELKMGSIQTIMASTGESLDKVNQKLDELNKYSDRTIYSFSDMTSNIGKFTNAGVKLDDAVSAIQGVSNVAAVSGANANEASRAMYNFAQALSAGYVKLIDWKSIENANMATVEFKTQLLESAVAAGTLTKTADGMYKTLEKGTVIDATHMFNDSLQEQWMTTEVLTSTLKDYADETTEIGKKAFAAAQDVKTWTQLLDTLKESAQSGWAETWQLIVGDYDQAKSTLREFSDFFSNIIDSSSEARNSVLKGALGASDTTDYIAGLTGMTRESIDEMRKLGKETQYSSDEFKELTLDLAEGDETISTVISHLAQMADGDKDVVSYIADMTGMTQESVRELQKLGWQAGYASDEFHDMCSTIAEGEPAIERTITELLQANTSGRELIFDSILNGLIAVQGAFSVVKGAWNEIFPSTTSEQLLSFIKALHSASEKIKDFFTQAEEDANGITGAINKPLQNIGNTFKGLFAVLDIVKQAFSALWRVITPAGSAFGGVLTGVLGLTGSFGEWLVKLDESIKKGDVFYKGLKSIVDTVKGAVIAVTDFAAVIGESLGFPSLDEARASVEVFLGTLKEKVGAPGLEKLQTIFDGICARVTWIKDGIVGMKDSIVDSMGKIDGAVSENKFVQVLTGIGTLIRQVANAAVGLLGKAIDGLMDALSNADFNGILDFLNALTAGGIIAAIRKFIDPVEELQTTFTSLKDWVKGLGGGVTKILDGVRGSLEAWQTKLKSDALGKIATSIAVLSVSLLLLSSIDSDKVTGSLAAMGTMFAELMTSMAILDKLNIDGKAANKTASAMIKMGAALLILSLAMKNIAELEPEQLAKGLVGVGVLLAEIDLFLNTAKFDKNASKSATGMILFATAIKILSSSVKSLGEMDWDDMAKGLTGVGVLLAEVEVFLNHAKFSGKAVLTATGIVILSSAIKVLGSACKDFGSMSWGEIAKGLSSIGALLLEITAFTKLTGEAKHVISTGLALIEIAAAMKIFASAMTDFASMSGTEIAKGLAAMGGALAEVAIAVNLMPKNMVGIGTGLVIVGAALKIVASALSSMGNMSWEEIGKGLVTMGGALAELAIGLNLIKGTLPGSAALLVAAGALAVLAPVLLTLGNMSWEAIAKGLITIAGAFTVIGVAGAVLGPLAPSILAISGALALLGVGSVAIGAGLTLIGTGLTSISVGLVSLATAFASGGTVITGGLSAIVLGFAGLIPAIAEKIGEAIVAFCGVISNGAPAIGEAVKAVVLTLVDVLVQCVPVIADGALQLVTGVLASLVTYTPQIIGSVMQFLIEVIEGVARNMPQLVKAAMDVVGAFFAGVLSALSNIDSSSLIQGIAAVGLLTALVAALGLVSGLIPAAMTGALGMGVVITELAAVLAAIGALAQIPGLEWLVSEGGQFLQIIGSAIGGFVGGIAGGFMSGVSSSFPQIGADLSLFMTNVKPFIDGASSISPEMLTGVKVLTEAIVLITAADLLEGLTSWLTGGSSLSDFAEQLVPFGEAMMKFSNTISGLDGGLVSTAAIAGKTLAEMAATLPNSGGVVGFFAGENDMEKFGNQLSGFGKSMMDFADSIEGLDSEAVQNAATAGKAMAEMAATLPNTGGVVGFFTGNNDMDTFGGQLVVFGKSIKEYSDAVAGLDANSVLNSATAGKALVELANTVPNTGGAVAFFTGDNDLGTFGEQIVVFGKAMKNYSQTVAGLDSEAVSNSTTAGSALVELAKTLPNTGGLISFFVGDNDLASFAQGLISFGEGMKAYSDTISGINMDAMTTSVAIAQALADLQTSLPKVGGLVQFFAGGNDLATFSEGLIGFAESMKAYSLSLDDLTDLPQTMEKTKLLISMVEILSALAEKLPASGGIFHVFIGNTDLVYFGADASAFAKSMAAYAEALDNLNNLSQTTTKTKQLTVMMSSLAALAEKLPKSGGFLSVFIGNNDLKTFGAGAAEFAKSMLEYANAMNGIGDISKITDKTNALISMTEALIRLSELAKNLGKDPFKKFQAAMKQLGDEGIKAFVDATTGSGKEIESAMTVMMNSVKSAVESKGQSIIQSMNKVLTGLVKAVKDKYSEMEKTGKDFMKQLANGMDEGKKSLNEAIERAAGSISGLKDKFFLAGVNIVNGLVSGIRSRKSEVGVASIGVCASALSDTCTAMGIHSPSTKFAEVGKFISLGLAQGIQNGVPTVRKSAKELAFDTLDTVKNTLDIHSPSEEFAEVGKQIDAGLAEGITANADQAKDAAKETVRDILQEAKDAADKMDQESIAHGGQAMRPHIKAQMVLGGVRQRLLDDSPVDLTDADERAVENWLKTNDVYIQALKELEIAEQNYAQAGQELRYNPNTNQWMNDWDYKKYNTDAAANLFKHDEDYLYFSKHIGENMAVGIHMGIVSKSDETVKDLQRMVEDGAKAGLTGEYTAFETAVNHLKEMGKLTTSQELAMWQGFMSTYVGTYDTRIKLNEKVHDLEAKMVEETCEASLNWIDREKKASRLSREEEIAGYNRMLVRYREGSEERLEIQERLNRALIDLDNERYQNSINWIEKEKSFGGLGLAGELAGYKRLARTYANNADRKAEADQKIAKLEEELSEAQKQYILDVQQVQTNANEKRLALEQEYADKVKSVNAQLERDIKQANDAYENAVKSRTDTLYRAYGLFDEVTEKEEVDSDQLMKNLEDQVLEFNQWQDILGSLSAKGLDGELMDELQQLGPSALGELKALNSMSDSELTKYESLWKDKHIQTRQQALSELEGLRDETRENIAEMKADAAKELDEYRTTWNEKMAQITVDTDKELERLRTEFAKKIGFIKENSEAQLREMAQTAQEIMRAAGWDETGQQIVDGMTLGIEERKSSFLDALTEMALAGVEAVQDTLDMHSPSRVFKKLGNFTGMGFVDGLSNYADKSYKAGANVAESCKEGLSNAIIQVSDLLNQGMNTIPAIRPVIDLSDTYSGIGNSGALLQPQNSIRLASQVGTAFEAPGKKETSVSAMDNRDVIQELRSLRSDMADMTQRIERMRIVLNTGALVGEMAGPMDDALGQKVIHRRRGL